MNTEITKDKMFPTTSNSKKVPISHWRREFEALESHPLEDMTTQLNFLRKIPVKKTTAHFSN